MEYNFMWSAPSSSAPVVTIARYGITFNSTTIEMMGRPKNILMGVDVKKRVVGFQAVEDADSNTKSYSFAERESKAGYIRIGNKDFVDYISTIAGFDTRKTYKFFGRWDSERQLLTIDLSRPTSQVDQAEEECSE